MNLMRSIHDDELKRLLRIERAVTDLRDCPHPEHFCTRLTPEETIAVSRAFIELLPAPARKSRKQIKLKNVRYF